MLCHLITHSWSLWLFPFWLAEFSTKRGSTLEWLSDSQTTAADQQHYAQVLFKIACCSNKIVLILFFGSSSDLYLFVVCKKTRKPLSPLFDINFLLYKKLYIFVQVKKTVQFAPGDVFPLFFRRDRKPIMCNINAPKQICRETVSVKVTIMLPVVSTFYYYKTTRKQ